MSEATALGGGGEGSHLGLQAKSSQKCSFLAQGVWRIGCGLTCHVKGMSWGGGATNHKLTPFSQIGLKSFLFRQQSEVLSFALQTWDEMTNFALCLFEML